MNGFVVDYCIFVGTNRIMKTFYTGATNRKDAEKQCRALENGTQLMVRRVRPLLNDDGEE